MVEKAQVIFLNNPMKFRDWLLGENQNAQLSLSGIKTFLLRGDYEGLKNYTYMALRQNKDDHEAIMQSYGNNREKIFYAYEQLVQTAHAKGGSWCEWYAVSKNLDQRVPKLYFTPGTGAKDMAGLLNNFRGLYDAVRAVAEKYQTPVGFKIPVDLWKYLEENDRLVVHMGLTPDPNQQQALAQELDAAIKGWASQSGVSLSNRTYSRGEDRGDRSFGVRVADTFVQELQKTLQGAGVDPSKPVPPQSADHVASWYANMAKHYLTNSHLMNF